MTSHLKKLLRRLLKVSHLATAFAVLYLLSGWANAYDNSVEPPFKLIKEPRAFRWLSIHPDGLQWLVSECSEHVEPPKPDCYVFLYHLGTRKYDRYLLPSGYFYSEAEFSPSGRYIVGIRRPYAQSDHTEVNEKYFRSAEIYLMRADGSEFKVLPVPKGLLGRPLMSLDEKRVAYWRAEGFSFEAGRRNITDHDLFEVDLSSGENRLFAGPFRFNEVKSFQYLDKDVIVAHAFGSATTENHQQSSYLLKTRLSHIYCLQRGQTSLTDPCVGSVAYASWPTMDRHLNLYFLGIDAKAGFSVYQVDMFGKYLHMWRSPKVLMDHVEHFTAATDGSYIGFLYTTTPTPRGVRRYGLGLFAVSEERWITVSIPDAPLSTPIVVKEARESSMAHNP